MSPHPTPITPPLFFASPRPNGSEPGQKDASLRFQMQRKRWTRPSCFATARRSGAVVVLGGTVAVSAQRDTRPLRSMLQNMCSCTWQPLNPVKLMDGPLTLDCISVSSLYCKTPVQPTGLLLLPHTSFGMQILPGHEYDNKCERMSLWHRLTCHLVDKISIQRLDYKSFERSLK